MCACSPQGQLYLRLHQKRVASRAREVILPLYSDLTVPTWSTVSRPRASSKGRIQSCSSRSKRRAMKMIKGLEHLYYEDGLRELGLYSLEKRRF